MGHRDSDLDNHTSFTTLVKKQHESEDDIKDDDSVKRMIAFYGGNKRTKSKSKGKKTQNLKYYNNRSEGRK